MLCELVNDNGTMKRGDRLRLFATEHNFRVPADPWAPFGSILSIPPTEPFLLLAEIVASHSVAVGDYTVVIGAAVDISFVVSE